MPDFFQQPNSKQNTRQDRLLAMLKTAMGSVVGSLLLDEEVEELALNDDGRLWAVRHGMRCYSGHDIKSIDAERLIRIVADAVQTSANAASPSFSAELPESGFRFHAVLPPQVRQAVFVIRKKPARVVTMDDYVQQHSLSVSGKNIIVNAIKARENILIAGGTGSGKTTLANAMLDVIAATGDRVLTVEDTRELICHAEDKIMMRTVPGVRTMQDCIRDMLRMTPTRIIVGEVRGPEVIDMLAGWNTGHPGGIATIHANSAADSLERIEDLYLQGNTIASRRAIVRAINLVIFIQSVVEENLTGQGIKTRTAKRKVQNIVRVTGLDKQGEYVFITAE